MGSGRNPFGDRSAASSYDRVRPSYPPELFAALAKRVASHRVAWDAGSGTGKAAATLVDSFDRVVATDASLPMLLHARPAKRVLYCVCDSSRVALRDHVVDLVVAAAAVHWFDLDPFYEEVRRVLDAKGRIVAMSYFAPVFANALDADFGTFVKEVLEGYWDPRTRTVMDAYRSLPFPFREEPAPAFDAVARWNVNEFLDYLDSLSAARAFFDRHGERPSMHVAESVRRHWGDKGTRDVSFPVFVRIGRLR